MNFTICKVLRISTMTFATNSQKCQAQEFLAYGNCTKVSFRLFISTGYKLHLTTQSFLSNASIFFWNWTDFGTLWEKMRVGYSERIALKQVYYQGWNRSPAQVGCMRQVLRAGALGRPRGMGWRGRWEGESGWGTHVTPWLIHVTVWQTPLQYCTAISLQLIKINEKN